MGDTGMARSATSQGEARQRRAGRRPRKAARRARRVEFSLTDEEFGELGAAAAQAGLSRGAYAAEAALEVARGGHGRVGVPLREALVELMSAAGLMRRVGTNLNQAVARLNATGQRGEDLVPATQFCIRVIRRLDEAAEHLRRSIP
jgi:Mobilization protein NikA